MKDLNPSTDVRPNSDLASERLPRSSVLDKTVLAYLHSLTDERREAILKFHAEHVELINISKGSQVKHQAWTGGYADHLAEIFRIAEINYAAYSAIRPLPFSLDSALIVLYFHDVEKIWKYTTGLAADFDKDKYYDIILKQKYGIQFSNEERNALHFVHGESDADYDPLVRKAEPLAAFCHVADHVSARIWFDEGKGLGV